MAGACSWKYFTKGANRRVSHSIAGRRREWRTIHQVTVEARHVIAVPASRGIGYVAAIRSCAKTARIPARQDARKAGMALDAKPGPHEGLEGHRNKADVADPDDGDIERKCPRQL